MSENLYITATEARSGKSVIALGIMEMLLRRITKVAFFRPIISAQEGRTEWDNDIRLISKYFNLNIPYEEMYGFTSQVAQELFSRGKEGEVIEGILSKYKQLEEKYDFVLCEGTDFVASTSAFEFDINAEIAKNLGCPVLLVANGHRRKVKTTFQSIDHALESMHDHGCQCLATVINRVDSRELPAIVKALKVQVRFGSELVYALPDNRVLGSPTVAEVAKAVGAEVLHGEAQLGRHVRSFAVAAMQLRNFLPRIDYGTFIITPGDRADVLVACLATVTSESFPNISGIVLTGGLQPEEAVWQLVKGFSTMVPILSVKEDTFPTARAVDGVHAQITPENTRKIIRALALFDRHVDVEELSKAVTSVRPDVVTPQMFEYNLLQKARKKKQHIVLPEGTEERILAATDILLRRDVVNITLLGQESIIRRRMDRLSLQLEGVNIIDPAKSERLDDYAESYYQLRKHKGITRENARDVVSDETFFGTMMIYKGHADGMVSGAVHTTRDTVRPAFEIIKTKPGFSIVSSVFFMCLADKVLVYGDCAVNPNPNASQLAEIAISSAETAMTFGVEPRVAMLSYSTGESGQGEDVALVREATQIAKEIAKRKLPDLKIEGPIQYDAAVDASVARTKMPDSEVAGKATVFIFPDLNTGNNTYKAVQRSAGAVAVGPVLQGLNRPVNDLSRGCTVPDIVNTVAITAIQAQEV